MSPGKRIADEHRKYELLPDQQVVVGGMTVYRIRALKDFSKVKAGALGGFIASERNLSQLGDCWVFDEAQVYEQAVVSDGAQIRGRACVHGHARVSDKGQVLGNAEVFEHGWIFKSGMVFDNAKVFGYAQVRDKGMVFSNAVISGHVRVLGHGQVAGEARINGKTVVGGHETVSRRLSRVPPTSVGSGRPRSPRGPRP